MARRVNAAPPTETVTPAPWYDPRVHTPDLSRRAAELNRRRLRVMAPLMAAVHVAHIALFHVPAAARASLSADVLRWRAGIVESHAVMLPFILVASWVLWRSKSARLLAAVGPVTAAAYLVHGALCSGFDQIVLATVTPYVGYCLGMAVIVALTPPQAIVAYAIGLATMVTMLSSSSERPARAWPTCRTSSPSTSSA